MEFTRSYALEDISVRSERNGRIVEAYATVFDTPAEVRDQDGEYIEENDPSMFNRAIDHARRSKGGFNIPVMFNHGMTLFHTPSEIDSMPIGVALDIKPEKRGLWTRSLYHNTPRADAVLEGIKDGSLVSQSFSGVFKRSSPKVPRGGFRRDSQGNLPTVRRMESTLREYGPATFAVYSGAEILGVRAEQVATFLSRMAPGEIDRLANLLTSSTRASYDDVDQLEEGTSDDSELAAEDQPEEALRTATPKELILTRYAEFLRKRSA